MALIRGLHNIRAQHRGCVATIGAFDGVHKGHQAVLEKLNAKAKELGLPSVVITLEPLPREYFAPVQAPPRIMSFREKYLALMEQGVDRVLRVRFDQDLSLVSAEDFIKDIFHDQLGIKYMIVGDDLRFGHERRGDFALLTRMGKELDFEVAATSTLSNEGERVSSTRIRQALEQADFAQAEELLGRPYMISGKVVYGQQLGRTLNTPTANLRLDRIRAAMSGVYAVDAILEGDKANVIQGVANVGTRPTVNDGLQARLEVHLLDFDKNIYGKHLDVVFRKKLRDEVKFSSLDALKAAIHNDIVDAKTFFAA
ncbi:MAG: bifunctional riboflavin kinase/FAD synthetase [Pseudomonadales bacterium]|nr:bifunctional riboflavin kinase/FAD synthetase [Pseudomonadales bacterium]